MLKKPQSNAAPSSIHQIHSDLEQTRINSDAPGTQFSHAPSDDYGAPTTLIDIPLQLKFNNFPVPATSNPRYRNKALASKIIVNENVQQMTQLETCFSGRIVENGPRSQSHCLGSNQ